MTLGRGLPHFIFAFVVAVAFAAPAHAQKYPTKPIRLVIGFPPGGSSDVVGRIVSEGAREVLGQPIVVENTGGAGGNIGMARAAKAPPDGYTLSLCTIGTCAINPSIYSSTGYDLQKDFTPVFLVGGVMNIFTVHPSMPMKTIKEFVTYAKANPGKMVTAIGGIGSSNHLTPVWFANVAGVNLLYVPFKGSGDSITALLGGEVFAFVDNEPSILPHIQSGRVRALAVTGPKRSTHLPNVPTMIESGYKDFVVEPWFGFQVPAGTPAPVVQTLNDALNKSVQTPQIKKRLEDAGLRVVGGPPERLRDQIASESARWAKVVKDNKIKAD